MKVTGVPIVNGAFGTVTKVLSKGMVNLEVGGRVKTIQTTALLKTARILRRILETWGDLQSLKLQWKIICWRRCEKLIKNISSRKCCDYSRQQRKIKGIEMICKYLDIARELKKKLLNMRETVILTVIDTLLIVLRGSEKILADLEIRWIESPQITALLRLTRMFRRFLETWGDLQSLRFQ